MMSIAQPLVIPPDVFLVPVAELPDPVRGQVSCDESDYAITRPRSRTPSKIIDALSAALLKEFQSPTKIVQAVLSFSRARDLDPEAMLEEAFPVIQQLVNSRLLVPADSEEARRIVPLLEAGDRVAGLELLSCIQVLEDTELYQVRREDGDVAALKILRPGGRRELGQPLEREAAILRHLNGSVSPRLYEVGSFEERPYLALEWCSGVPAPMAAEELRRQSGARGRAGLLKLGGAILNAYACLHAQGVLHSDVHPHNILVDGDGSVRIIDYGLARWEGMAGEAGGPPRGGVGFYFEPEYARACLEGRWPPPSTAAGEQYALAALLYLLFTGAHSQDFSLERGEMLRQIAEESLLPFSRRGIPPWPAVEELLARALRKEPGERFASVSEFASRLGDAARREEAESPEPPRETPADGAAETLLNEWLERVGPGGPLLSSGLTAAPTGSVNYGAAGIACALYRIACIRSDAALLSLADLWSNKALRQSEKEEAFYNPEMEITRETVGSISAYHTASGLYCVQGLISHAMGDALSQHGAVQAFIAASSAPCRGLDLTLGRSSTLLAGSLLLDTISGSKGWDEALIEFGEQVKREIWDELCSYAAISECSEISYLGIAHGWAGLLYATMRWCRSAGRPLPGAIHERLSQVAGYAERVGRGARWPWVIGRERRPTAQNSMSGWCNGSAGYVYLWILAHQMLHDEVSLSLAERAAWNAWEEPDNGGSLCCGLAGRAFALLCLYKHTGERDWLRRARELAHRAAVTGRTTGSERESLYKGETGVAVLAADLARPEASCMPFFEQEGWPARA